MLVVVQGDPLQLASTVVGLDILGPRHPKLHSLLVARLGFQTAPDSQVGQGGDRCPLGNVSGTTTDVMAMSLGPLLLVMSQGTIMSSVKCLGDHFFLL